MEIKIYSEEIFERGRLRYVIFCTLGLSVILLSFFYDNIYGALMIGVLTGVYLYFQLKKKEIISLKITPKGLILGEKNIPWINVKSYAFEVEKKTLKIKNIVVIYHKKFDIYTIADSIDKLKPFSENLNNYIPLVGEFEQTGLEKFYRKIKL